MFSHTRAIFHLWSVGLKIFRTNKTIKVPENKKGFNKVKSCLFFGAHASLQQGVCAEPKGRAAIRLLSKKVSIQGLWWLGHKYDVYDFWELAAICKRRNQNRAHCHWGMLPDLISRYCIPCTLLCCGNQCCAGMCKCTQQSSQLKFLIRPKS